MQQLKTEVVQRVLISFIYLVGQIITYKTLLAGGTEADGHRGSG